MANNTVLIAEPDPRIRRALVASFEQIPVEVWIAPSAGEIRAYDESTLDPQLIAGRPIALLIAHNTNLDKSMLPLLLKKCFAIGPIVRYSTVGGDKTEPAELMYWIDRPITRRHPLTPSEAVALVDWATGQSGSLPPLLLPKVTFETLLALAVLCQGYLVGHVAAAGQRVPEGTALAKAVALMMLPSASGSELVAELGAAASAWSSGLLQRASWWVAPFAFDEAAPASARSAASGQLVAGVRAEWGDAPPSPEISRLTSLLVEERAIEDPELVAAVYCQLVDRLA